jgi:hypothetical protein
MAPAAFLVNLRVAELPVLLPPEKQLQRLFLRKTVVFREIHHLDALCLVLLDLQVCVLLVDQVVYVLVVDFKVRHF